MRIFKEESLEPPIATPHSCCRSDPFGPLRCCFCGLDHSTVSAKYSSKTLSADILNLLSFKESGIGKAGGGIE